MQKMLFFVLLVAATLRLEAAPIVLDGRNLGRTFEGLGALSAGASSRLLIDYPEPQRSRDPRLSSSSRTSAPPCTI